MASYYTHTRKDATPLCGYLHLYPFLALSAPSLAHVQVGDLCVVVNHPGLLDAVENRLDHVVTVWPLGVRHAQPQGQLALRQAPPPPGGGGAPPRPPPGPPPPP